MKLSGYEASVLAFIARFPKSDRAAALVETLDEPAKEIAQSLRGELIATGGGGAAATAIQRWADNP